MKNKSICIGMVLCILLSLVGCKQAPINPGNQNSEMAFLSVMLGEPFLEEAKEDNVITRVMWNTLRLSESDEAKFPKLKTALDELNTEAQTDAKALMYELSEAAKDFAGTQTDPLYLEGESKVFFQRADTKLVSYVEDVFVYSGGVHPDYHYVTTNLNSETGEKLLLTDVMKSVTDLPHLLEEKLNLKYSYVNFGEQQLATLFQEYAPEDYSWTLDYQGITFWFSPYDIAAYAVGPLSAKIYFEEAPEFFNEEYTKAPSGNYAVMLPIRQKFDFDLNPEDGKKDYVETDTLLDQYGSYQMLSVTKNGQTVVDEINYAYEFALYLARVGNKSYLYSESYSDGDYNLFCTWDLNGEAPMLTEQLSDTELDYEYVDGIYDGGIFYKQVLQNPDSFRLATHFDILGTRGSVATYQLSNADGTPQMTDEAYAFTYGHEVKTAIPLEAELLPDRKKTTLPAGTRLTPYQTDGKTYVDLKTESGEIVRLAVDTSDWPRTVNGIPEEECFEELLYAG